jgi:hypothetical protein
MTQQKHPNQTKNTTTPKRKWTIGDKMILLVSLKKSADASITFTAVFIEDQRQQRQVVYNTRITPRTDRRMIQHIFYFSKDLS